MNTNDIKCKSSYVNKNCKKLLNKTNHEGTKVKYQAIERYIESWFEKTRNYYSKGNNTLEFTYIDIFSGSGLSYDTKNDRIIDGSISRVIKIFKQKANLHPNIKFNWSVNTKTDKLVNYVL